MRNLTEYPVTFDEILEELNHHKQLVIGVKAIGDIRPTMYSYLEDFLNQPDIKRQFELFLEANKL